MIKKIGATQKLITFLNEVSRIPGVISATVNSCVPGNEINFHSNAIYPSGNPDKSGDNFGILTIDHHFQDVFEPKIFAGQMFTDEDRSGGPKVVINMEACRRLGYESPETAIGKFVHVHVTDYLYIPDTPYLVSGVIEDFHQESPRKRIEPILLIKDYHWKYEVGFIAFRFNTSVSEQEIFGKFKDKLESFYPADPCEFQYTVDTYRLPLKDDEKLAVLSLLYTICVQRCRKTYRGSACHCTCHCRKRQFLRLPDGTSNDRLYFSGCRFALFLCGDRDLWSGHHYDGSQNKTAE
jgi:putative ABC transport system permease protein